MATRPEQLYDEDFYAWTRDQAAALRRLAAARWNGPLDLAHLAEEVEDWGTTTRNAVRSQLERVIEHVLKLAHSSATEPRSVWMSSIDDARSRIEDAITPVIRQDAETMLPRLYARARRRAVRDLIAHGERAATVPEACPWDIERLLTEDWYPGADTDET